MFAHRQRHAAPSTRTDRTRYAPSARSMQYEAGMDVQSGVGLSDGFSDFGLAMLHSAQFDGEFDGDPLERARAVPFLEPQVDGQLEVRTEEAVASASRSETSDRNTAFLALDADPKLGFTFPTAGPDADPSMPVRMGRPGEDRRREEANHLEETGIHTLADYRAMLVQDFNFGGLVERLAGVPSLEGQDPQTMRTAGEDAFLQLAVARFHPGLSADDPAVETTVAVARNIWSYATCGADVEGRSDISELQGLLYLFDGQIRDSSDTNTEMADGTARKDWFVIPGTEDWETPLKAKRGDGRHGTATVRTTRHLMAKLEGTQITGFDESYLLLDHTTSMGNDEYQHLSSLMNHEAFTGSFALAGFESTISEVQGSRQLEKSVAQQHLKNPVGPLGARGGHECTMRAALEWLQRIDEDGVGEAERNTARQMVILTDATDNEFSVEDLRSVQQLAGKLNMSIKVMYSYVSSNPNVYEARNADAYMLVDVMKMNPDAIEADWYAKHGDGTELDWRQVGIAQGAAPQKW